MSFKLYQCIKCLRVILPSLGDEFLTTKLGHEHVSCKSKTIQNLIPKLSAQTKSPGPTVGGVSFETAVKANPTLTLPTIPLKLRFATKNFAVEYTAANMVPPMDPSIQCFYYLLDKIPKL